MLNVNCVALDILPIHDYVLSATTYHCVYASQQYHTVLIRC
jgi:hypothetical protein